MAMRPDPGYGPPPGSSSDTPYAQPLSFEQEQKAIEQWGVGSTNVDQSDPGFQPPRDQLQGNVRSTAKLIYRDLPLVTIQNGWSVQGARSALYSHNLGIFEMSGQLWDSILGDDRVMATLGSRSTGLFGREVRFTPADDSLAAREVCDEWVKHWPKFSGNAGLRDCSETAIGMGFSPAQLVWDTAKPIWCPYMRPWHPRYTYYHWSLRKFIALSMDGQIPIIPGNGKWLLHAPFGEYRGWIRGAIRAVTEPWMLRHFAFRDMARFSEVHGIPTRVGKVPAVSDPDERSAFEAAIANLGSDTSMILPQAVDGQEGCGYEYDLVEATDNAWEVFPGLIDRCDMAIVLSLLFQNLTTEVKGGSFAATDAHMDIRQGGLQGDNQAWKNTLYNQVARPFAFFNFGDADLAPWTFWDVEPRADLEGNARMFQAFGTAVEVMARGGLKFTDSEEVRRFAAKSFGLNGLPDFTIGDPAAAKGGGGFGT